MAGKGWIRVHRSITDCFIWTDKPFDKARAWIDLLLLAYHDDKKIMIDAKPFTVERGSYLISRGKLADRWGWSLKKLDNYLRVLEKEDMVTTLSTKKGIVITIVNYDKFQVKGATEDTAEDTTQDTVEDIPEGIAEDTAEDRQNNKLKELNKLNELNNSNTGGDAPKPPKPTQEHSFAKHTNVQNLDYVIEHNGLTVDGELYVVLADWMDYKDKHKPKAQNHYDTERGIKTVINQFNEHYKDYGLSFVVKVVEYSIGNNYSGLFWDNFKSGKGNYTYKPQQTTTSNDLDPQIQAQLRALEEQQLASMPDVANMSDEDIDRLIRGEL